MHYLKRCHGLHTDLTRLKYGKEQDLRELEKRVEDIKSGRELTEKHIEDLRENARCIHLDLEQFGSWPKPDQLKSDLHEKVIDFPDLPESGERVVKQLYSVFKQIEVVSVILRFIQPKHYGILSPPVGQVLGIGPSYTHVGKYFAYVRDLHKIRAKVGLENVAEVDMALWVLSVGVLNEELRDGIKCEELEKLQKEHGEDLVLRTIRAENLTGQLFRKLKRRELAEALNGCTGRKRRELAGQIAAMEFEKCVRRLLGANPDEFERTVQRILSTDPEHILDDEFRRTVVRLSGGRPAHIGLWDLVTLARVYRHDVAQVVEEEGWYRAVRTRNSLIHDDGQWKYDDVNHLIKVMKSASGLH